MQSRRAVLTLIIATTFVFVSLSLAERVSSANQGDEGVSPGLSLIVNSTGDAADVALDGVCDSDPGTPGDQCTLRAAIQETNNAPSSDTITFSPGLNGSTITLTNVLDSINGNLTITGPGSNLLTIRRSSAAGTPDFRIFTIGLGQSVSMSGLTLTNGNAQGGPGAIGGGISNAGTLTLSDCVLTANTSSGSGGGIINFGTVTLNDSTVSNNVAANGAGIYSNVTVSGSVSVTLNNSTVSGNQANGVGAGITNSAGSGTSSATLTINNSTISGNVNAGTSGGGIFNFSIFGNAKTTLTIRNSTISGNSAPVGGGIYMATNGQGAAATGTITNTTITNNNSGSTTQSGGGIFSEQALDTVLTLTLKNTLIAGNLRSLGTIPSDVFGPVDPNSSNNLIGVDSGLTGITNGTNSNQIGTAGVPIDPRVGPLLNNGGRTQTHALLAGSPALDAGDNTSASNAGLTTDQRGAGFGRIRDAADVNTVQTVDIGAFEADPAIEDIPNKSTNEDTQLSFAFNVGDAATPFDSINAVSSNTILVPNANIVIGPASASTRTLTITPAPDQFGTTVISVAVTKTIAGTVVTITDSFTLTVNSVNDNPTTSGVSDVSVNEDAVNSVITLTVSFSDVEDGSSALGYSIRANTNPGLFTSTVISDGAITLDYAPNAFGSADITIRATDSGGLFVEDTFTVTVASINDAPVNSVPGTQNFPDNSILVFSSATSNPILISDVDAAGNQIQVSLSATNGILSLASTSGLNFTVGDGTDDPTITFTGTLTNVNTALNGLSFKPTPGFTGAGSLQITSNDLGNSGAGGQLTDADVIAINVLPTLAFSASSYSVNEDAGVATITVNRTGSTAQAVSVDYATSDISTNERRDYTTTLGTLTIPSGAAFATFTIPITVDAFNETAETVALTLSNPTAGLALGSPQTATLQINNVPNALPNPIDDPGDFVDQHYHDFLNRAADPAGRQFWVNGITSCNGDPACIEVKRINTSAAFFLSIEFQETGFTVFLTHRAAFGSTLPAYRPFERDTQSLQRGFVFGQQGAEIILEGNKVRFFDSFVQRPEFTAIYGSLTNAQYVDTLISNTGVIFTGPERDTLLNGLNAATETRATVLRKVVEKNSFKQSQFNRGFVYMQYIGYLRRNPTDSPDNSLDGFTFWLNKLNQFNGDFIQAEMVKAFIQSTEYRGRFAP